MPDSYADAPAKDGIGMEAVDPRMLVPREGQMIGDFVSRADVPVPYSPLFKASPDAERIQAVFRRVVSS